MTTLITRLCAEGSELSVEAALRIKQLEREIADLKVNTFVCELVCAKHGMYATSGSICLECQKTARGVAPVNAKE